jgi:adenylate kinase family enzyme
LLLSIGNGGEGILKKIMVLGVSSGVGKSTFARKLGDILDIDVHHLDKLHWKPNWVEASREEFTLSQLKVLTNDQWIIDGNYSSTFDIRMQHADTIIYLELPLRVCLYRVFKRWIMNIGKTRPDMGEGCKEKLDYQFLKFICTTYFARKEKMKNRINTFLESGSNKKSFILKSKKEIRSFLRDMSECN